MEKFHNKKPVAKPRTRWNDVVPRDTLQIVGIGGWRRRAEDREEWRRLLTKVRAQKGLEGLGWNGIVERYILCQ
jgi:hypothetical protein